MTEYGCILATCGIGRCDDAGDISGIRIDGVDPPHVIKLLVMAK